MLSTVNYTDKKGVINKATPNLAVYWVKVTVPAGPRTVAIDQSITSGNFTQKLTLANGSKVVNAACGNVKQQTVDERRQRIGDGRVHGAHGRDVPDRRPVPLERGQRPARPRPRRRSTTCSRRPACRARLRRSISCDRSQRTRRRRCARPDSCGSCAAKARDSLAGLDRFGGQPRQRVEHDVGLRPSASSSGGKWRFGIATTRIPAALAARMPLCESSTRRRAPGRRRAGAPPRGRRRAPACRGRPPPTRRSPRRGARRRASSSTRSISSRFDEDASPSGQRAASRSTASRAPGSEGQLLAVEVATAARRPRG